MLLILDTKDDLLHGTAQEASTTLLRRDFDSDTPVDSFDTPFSVLTTRPVQSASYGGRPDLSAAIFSFPR